MTSPDTPDTKRELINLTYEKEVPAGGQDIQASEVIPDKQTWFISKIVVAHAANSSGYSGELEVLFGSEQSSESLCRAFLTGDTREYTVNRDFVGDGVSSFITRRGNLDPLLSARMFVTIRGFKKING